MSKILGKREGERGIISCIFVIKYRTEMWKSQERVKKLDVMVKKRNLPEREQLVFQLQELQEQLKIEEDKTIVS